MSTDSLQTRVREVLRNIVAEEELEGVVDLEITKARENLKVRASRVAEEYIATRLKKWVESWASSEGANKSIDSLGDAMIEKIMGRWLDENDYDKARRVQDTIDDAMLRALQSKVDEKLGGWRTTPEMDETAAKIVQNLIPRASALALEQLAIRALNERLVVVSHNLGMDVTECSSYSCNGKVAPGQYCSKCGTQKRS